MSRARRSRPVVGCLLAALLAFAALPAPVLARPAAESYTLHCSGCHGRDGRGVPGVVPTLRGLGRLLAEPGGRAYLVRVPGVAQAPAGDAELAALLDWVLLSFSGASPEPAYSAAEVHQWRARPLRDPIPARPVLSSRTATH